MIKQEETQRRLSERICKTKTVGELMEILFKRFEDNGGVIDIGDFVYVPTKYGTVVYTKEEFEKIRENENQSVL